MQTWKKEKSLKNECALPLRKFEIYQYMQGSSNFVIQGMVSEAFI